MVVLNLVGRRILFPLRSPLFARSCSFLDFVFWHMASEQVLAGDLPCLRASMLVRVVVHVYVELANGLPLACMPSSGLLRLAWQQLDTHHGFAVRWRSARVAGRRTS
jgi:hypothetical protein